jgi:perosamine synthetase
MIPITVVEFGEDAERLVLEVLRSGNVAQGSLVRQFEDRFAEMIGVKHAIALNNGTTSLVAALQVLDLEPGDEVVTSPFTFVATLNAILEAGATARFADISEDDFNVTVEGLAGAVTDRTRVLMPVHLYGQIADMDAVAALASERGLALVEDSAQSHGSTLNGRHAGSYGLGSFSFYATKNITTAEGGALATLNPCLAGEVERLALHGLSAGAWQRYSDAGFRHFEVASPGLKANMSDLAASIGLHQLPQLEVWTRRRTALAARYDALLADLPLETPPPVDPRARHAWHLYSVLVRPEAGVTRDELLDGLLAHRIGTGVHYRGVHLHPYYRDTLGVRPEDLPVASDVSQRTLSLPFGPKVTEADQDDVVAALAEALA